MKEILDLLAILQKTKKEPFVGLGDGGDQRERGIFLVFINFLIFKLRFSNRFGFGGLGFGRWQ